MPRGYAGKLLQVDLSTENIEEMRIEDNILRNYVGGRGLAGKILWDRLGYTWETVDPLGPENLLLALTGPLTGFYPGARICVSGKSPQSNGLVGSTTGGEFPIELKCSGYDGIVISGRARSPVYIFINDDEVGIKSASHLWGKDGKETVKMITSEIRRELGARYPNYGKWKEPAILYIGPAGENRVRAAAVMQKWAHAAGYGGYGAVMGSKNLKALVAKGTGPMPDVEDTERTLSLMSEIRRGVMERGGHYRRWGTGYDDYWFSSKTSSVPVRNWQEEWHEERRYGGDIFDRRFWVKKYWGDFSCPVTCLKIAFVKTGPYKGAISDNPDFELQAYLGPNLGIFDPDANIYLSALVDDLGLSGINGGNILAFAAELYERGILTKDDLGIELNWGDAHAFGMLAEKIARREGIGDILAEGTFRASLKMKDSKKIDVKPYAVHVKGIEVGAHGTRSGLGGQGVNPIGYACSSQGGDHGSTVRKGADRSFADSAVVCNVVSWCLGSTPMWEMLRPVTGLEITSEEWRNVLGRRIAQIERAVVLLGGPDVIWKPLIDDELPPRFYEPLPSGPKAGQSTDRKKFEKMRDEYYNYMGWDEKGIPKSDELKRLGLEDVDRALNKIRE